MRPWLLARWRRPQHYIANYSTALQQNLQDDNDLSQVASIVGHRGDHEDAESLDFAEAAASSARVQHRCQRRLSLSQRRWKEVDETLNRWKRHPLRQRRISLGRSAPSTWTAAQYNIYRQRRITVGRARVWTTANSYTLARDVTSRNKPRTGNLVFTWWQRQYANIASFYATYRKRRKGDEPRVPLLSPQAFEWAEVVLDKLESGQTVITAEEMRSEGVNNWRYFWEQVTLWLLRYDSRSAVQFLLATNSQKRVESYHFEDALLQLARFYKHRYRTAHIPHLAEAFCTMVEERPERELVFLNEFITLLVRHSPYEQRRRIFDTINNHKVKIHPYTWLHMTTLFAHSNHFETALDCLLKAHEHGARLDDYAFRSNCTTILRRSSEQPDGLRVCLRVVSTLVDIGVKFNLAICNVIMLNAVEAGDLKTAFSVYHSLMERGLKPDEATFLVLLKGCRMNIDDAQLLDEIIRDAIGNINVRQNEKVATEILYCLALHHSKHNPANALNTIAEAYAQLFDLTPLQTLGLPISPTLQAKSPAEKPMPPTRHAITFLINATINHYLTTAPTPTSNTKPLVDLYTRWRTHVENTTLNPSPALAALASTDHVSNTFLTAFTRHQRTLLFAARVVRDMQRPLPPTSLPGITQAKPTVQTWSIFLLGFTRHKQMKLAEQVLTYMRKEGIQPNQVTWNSLTAGYAGAQDLEGTVEVLRRAEAEGMVWDFWTRRGLRFLREREGLEVLLKRRRVSEVLDFSSELKVGLAERLGGDVLLSEEVDGLSTEEGGALSSEEASALSSEEVNALPVEEAKVMEVQGFGDSAAEIAEQGMEGEGNGAYRPFT